MYTVLGIDQSFTSTGICVLDVYPNLGCSESPQEVIHTEVIQTSKKHEDFVWDSLKRAEFIANRITEICGEFKPDFICVETPSLASKGNATRTLPMLLGILLTHLPKEDGVEYRHVPPTTLKKFATGKGNSTKDGMVDALEPVNSSLYSQLMNMPKSHGRYDIADAYWLARHTAHSNGD